MSNKNSAELRQEQETIRSPSPETIARMAESGPAMSPSSQAAETFEKRPSYPPASDHVEETSQPSQRARSPKPEADGRLDRSFKFPLNGQKPTIRTQMSGSASGSGSDVALSSPQIQTPIVHIQAPSTDGPMSAPVGYTPDDEVKVPIEEVSPAAESKAEEAVKEEAVKGETAKEEEAVKGETAKEEAAKGEEAAKSGEDGEVKANDAPNVDTAPTENGKNASPDTPTNPSTEPAPATETDTEDLNEVSLE